jgi:hypothetical protein
LKPIQQAHRLTEAMRTWENRQMGLSLCFHQG